MTEDSLVPGASPAESPFYFEQVRSIYEPFPVFYFENFLSARLYQQLVDCWPELYLFAGKPNLGAKLSLSERNNRDKYNQFIKSKAIWTDFHAQIKSPFFLADLFERLKTLGVDLSIDNWEFCASRPSFVGRAFSRLRKSSQLGVRFEFSMMHCHGGNILPHTDDPKKLITMVISMNNRDEWNQEWGGGTQICTPKERIKLYNQKNRYLTFEETDVISEFPFVPNQCICFIKTYNSWHQVSPLRGPEQGPYRKTLTLNVELLD